MVNLARYSDQIIPENSAIDIRLLELMKAKAVGTRIAYVPSGPEPDRQFFHDRKSYYAQYNLDLIWVYDLNELPSAQQTADLFGCGAIHLSGGHTAGFLQRLRSVGMLDPLRNWALQGGILIGTSAGAILMTPTIAVDALFSDKRPEEVTDGGALNLLPFEFFPHLNANAGYLTKLMTYSRHTERPIVAVKDGEGVVVTGEMIECIGNPVWIFQGAIKQATAIEFADMKVLQKS
ncbi:Type 1 glutamine amidotransferase-like domain-containing protein [Agrobacterium tumefaciens]|uniref:Type 1 glutamine amidotransferase-like domain-containing protein n=1 Tax=Agrobacterium tumefaciens TaxID=358 RepID=UPI001572220A|nr:type 1 glutamine amidotransferase-like domain-containing protein [Agrobacterium tumefaciens]